MLNQTKVEPTVTSERIPSLDFLRGVAILGILFINIESFVYPNPWSSWQYGYESAIDHNTRFWVYFLTQGKFYTMFALLFGVGFVIFMERIQQRVSGIKAMDIYVRRLLWLFIIGVIHAYFIWDGDILYHYAICGLLLLPFRSIANNHLILVLLFLASFLFLKSYESATKKQETYARYVEASNKKETEKTEKDEKLIASWKKRYSKKLSGLSKKVNAPKPTYWQGLVNSYQHLKVHKGEFYYQSLILSSLIVMIIGMLLFRVGIFSDYKTWKYYWLITSLVLVIGLVVNYTRYYHWTYEDHIPNLSTFKALLFTFPKELLGIAYVLLLNGIYQKYLKNITFKVFTKIGRTALSNYIFQSVILGFLFYGYGLGMHNGFSRFQLLGFVVAIWSIQILCTILWLKHYQQGPLEFIWRKLTYKSFNKN
ncbi:DUF418 domain-containing protein [Tenacibaculum caenipelagi]|uniref:DUF418 domain-containing protein n=1 Tax=Tenacibaculum caenipelagi TaxID=1325435 RepID=A0A4R6TCA8_9FLAO|nr:DUF418 domain-containing protein [Tenacibaculum caenipelagi]TDQ24034.1 uncharacterized protein DFQ07_2576 [Tenacibaculum caenipelagi]